MSLLEHLRDASALARQGALIGTRHARRPVQRRRGAPIYTLFVHGYLAASPIFDPMRRRLTSRLDIDTSTIDYTPLADVDMVIATVAEVITREADGRPTVLVGHSLGGLLVRAASLTINTPPKLIVTLATPHRGTTAAARVPGSLAQMLRPGSALQRRLSHAPLPARALNLIADRDRTVPHLSALWPGSEEHLINGVGHNAIVFDNAAWAHIERAIEPSFTTPKTTGSRNMSG